MARFDDWEVSQLWHFLGGLVGHYREPMRDEAGAPVLYGRVPGFEQRSTSLPPGVVETDGAGWRVWARDGFVSLAADRGAQ